MLSTPWGVLPDDTQNKLYYIQQNIEIQYYNEKRIKNNVSTSKLLRGFTWNYYF